MNDNAPTGEQIAAISRALNANDGPLWRELARQAAERGDLAGASLAMGRARACDDEKLRLESEART